MTDVNRSVRGVRAALVLFGLPFAAAVAGLNFRTALVQVAPILPAVLELVAAASAIGLVVTILTAWIADRRMLRRQDLELREQTTQLTLKRQEYAAQHAQNALELKLRAQALEHAVASREQRIRIAELESALEAQRRQALPEPDPAPTPESDGY